MHSHSIITYIVVLPDKPEGDSPFQGFAFRLLEVRDILPLILRLPASYVELNLNREGVIAERAMMGGYQIIPLDASSLHQMPTYPAARFVVVISGPQTDDSTSDCVSKFDFPILHVTTSESPDILHLKDLTTERLRSHGMQAIEFINAHHSTYVVPELGTPAEESPQPLSLQRSGHLATLPNETALESFGYDMRSGEPIIKPLTIPSSDSTSGNETHAKIILESANELNRVRSEALLNDGAGSSRAACDLILTASAVFHHVSPDQLSPEIPEADRQALGIVMRTLTTQKSYPQFVGQGGDFLKMAESVPARILLGLRRAEVEVYTHCLSARASGYAAPVLRLPPAVNYMRGQLRDLTNCIKGNSPRKSQKLSKLARRVGDIFRNEIEPDHMRFIETLPSHAAVKLITDAPLELIPVNSLPLGIRFVTSRLPVTPGNLLSMASLTSRPILIEPSAIMKVLVVSAFKANDSLKGLLPRVVSEFIKHLPNLQVHWVEVDGVESFQQALNSFDGAILVFDGHGSYSRVLNEGSLKLGAETVDVWGLKNTVRIPPIVLLSACETHPMDGTQATVGNAFLMLGAHAVLASLVPLSGVHAAIFVGRLMLRLGMYVPEVEQTPIFPIRWSELITGMLRMSYVTDLVKGLRSAGWTELNENAMRRIMEYSNNLISYLHPDWFDETLNAIATECNRSVPDVKAAHLRYAYFTDSLHYVHLGNPEEIVIVPTSDTKDVSGGKD
jgi:hypothetical protein